MNCQRLCLCQQIRYLIANGDIKPDAHVYHYLRAIASQAEIQHKSGFQESNE